MHVMKEMHSTVDLTCKQAMEPKPLSFPTFLNIFFLMPFRVDVMEQLHIIISGKGHCCTTTSKADISASCIS